VFEDNAAALSPRPSATPARNFDCAEGAAPPVETLAPARYPASSANHTAASER
jgi:hypothetical protein